jgi:YjbE family integral membrane protein
LEFLFSPHFWAALSQIVVIDILLGGDNAVVIALACRKLPPAQRVKGIIWGTVGAIALRVVLIAFALALLGVPYLKLLGAVALVWIGVKLMHPEDEEHNNIATSDKLWVAVRTIIVADLVMSVDNVIGIAGAAQNAGEEHQLLLVSLGLLISIPIIVWGSQLVIRIMDRFPWVITLGAMLLGWIAASMAWTDAAVVGWIGGADPAWMITRSVHIAVGVCGALLVAGLGWWTHHRIQSTSDHEQTTP